MRSEVSWPGCSCRMPPLGRIAFGEWLDQHQTSIGRSSANELNRHFGTNLTA
jgi:hypothetical protein